MRRRSPRRGIFGLLWLLVAPSVSCGASDESTSNPSESNSDGSRETIRIAREGGQTGMEGGCGPRPEPTPFSADDARAMIEGSHQSSLAYRLEQRSLSAPTADVVGLPMTVTVELQGESRDPDPSEADGCNLRIAQDVKLTLSFEQPPLDVVIETTAHAFSSDFVVIQADLNSDVSVALGLPSADVILSLSFNVNGMKGTLDPHGDYCGAVVFPSNARCPDWPNIEVDLDRERAGFRPRDAVAMLDELGEIPLRWTDGTETSLSVSLTEGPQWACSNDWVESFRPETLLMPISVRMVSADGRLDAELPADLAVEVTTEAAASPEAVAAGVSRAPGVVESLSVQASYFGDARAGDVGLKVNVWRSAGVTGAEGFVHTVDSRALALAPPLDATLDTTAATCLWFTGGAAPEIE